jgi:hypothetical protein
VPGRHPGIVTFPQVRSSRLMDNRKDGTARLTAHFNLGSKPEPSGGNRDRRGLPNER